MVKTEYIHITYDACGRARIRNGPLIAVIAFMHNAGDTLEDIAEAYPGISTDLLGEALDHYAAHRRDVDKDILRMQRPPRGYHIGPNNVLQKT